MSRSWLLPLGTGLAGAVVVALTPHSLLAVVATTALLVLTAWLCLRQHARSRWWPLLGLGSSAVLLEVIAVFGLLLEDHEAYIAVVPALALVAITGSGVVAWRLLQERFSSRAHQQLMVALVAATAASVPTWVILVEPHLSTVGGGSYALAVGTAAGAALALGLSICAWMLGDTGGSHTIPLFRGAMLVMLIAQLLALSKQAAHVPLQAGYLSLLLLGAGLVAAAAANPSPQMRLVPPRAPIGVRGSVVSVFVVALLVGPMLTGIKLTSRLDLSLGAIAIGTGLLSVAVAAALVLVLRDFNHADFWVQHDQLTGLPNKLAFRSRLDEAIAAITPGRGELSVLFLDLDRFKVVNDSLGHSAGDQLLEGVADRLALFRRENVEIARLGGDEFGILVDGPGSDDRSRALAAEIVSQFREPFLVGGRSLHIAPSIGVARYPVDGRSSEDLLRNADSAMYRAKEAGSAQVMRFHPEMHVHAVGRLNLESSLHDAIARNQLELHYQPQYDARSVRIVGAEALLRWRHPDLGLLSPDRFIPIAEETGLIVPIGEWVLAEAARQTVVWLPNVDPSFTMAVNLSPRQLELEDVVGLAAHALRLSGLGADHLELEVTESVAMGKRVDLEATFTGLSELGVSLAIDDFGTGFSGLGYLHRLPVDRIKIDGSFIRAIDGDRPDSRLVVAVLGLARTMGLEVIAEGVETQAQRDFLLAHDCPLMQGFHFARPMHPHAFEELLGADADAEVDVVPTRADRLTRFRTPNVVAP